MATQTTVFVVDYEDQVPALWFIEHECRVDAKRMLRMAAQDYIDQHPDIRSLGFNEVFDLPEAVLAAYGLKLSPQRFLVEDWDEEDFVPDGTEG